MRAKRINSDIAHIIFFLRFGGVRFHSGFPHLWSEHRGDPRLQGTPLRLPEQWQGNSRGSTMSKNGTILIIFAWAMEIVGVTGGAINSIYTTFGDNLPNTVWGYVPAVPMAALAMAEFGRVPLASTIFSKHKLIQGIAVLG